MTNITFQQSAEAESVARHLVRTLLKQRRSNAQFRIAVGRYLFDVEVKRIR